MLKLTTVVLLAVGCSAEVGAPPDDAPAVAAVPELIDLVRRVGREGTMAPMLAMDVARMVARLGHG